jgi:starvation-inducible DNA-binding protein
MMDIGITATDRAEIAAGLSRLLADSFTLYADPQLPLEREGAHVQQPAPDVHGAIHRTVERPRRDRRAHPRPGHPAPGTFSEFARLSIEAPEGVPAAKDMIRLLVAAQEATARTARGLFPLVDKASDQPTADLLTQRLEVHEKTAWMLRSLLEE